MTKAPNSGVYRWHNVINGKCYVGSSSNLEKRRSEHLRELKADRHHSPKLQNAWNKYGEGSFEFEVLSYCPEATLLAEEQLAMWAFDAVKGGYNIAVVAGSPMRGRTASVETRQKISLAGKGRKQSPEHVEKRIAGIRGLRRTAAVRAKLSSLRKNKPATQSQLKNLALGWQRPQKPKQPRLRVPLETIKANMRAAWTPERRAAQAARIAQLNKQRAKAGKING